MESVLRAVADGLHSLIQHAGDESKNARLHLIHYDFMMFNRKLSMFVEHIFTAFGRSQQVGIETLWLDLQVYVSNMPISASLRCVPCYKNTQAAWLRY